MDKVKELANEGKIKLLTKYQLKNVNGSEKLESIDIMHDDKKYNKSKV